LDILPNQLNPIEYRKQGQGNPWYPLPPDYGELSKEGQKQARLATLRRQSTPMELVAAWDLFRRLYLMTTEPGFFYHNFAPSPPFHYEAIHDLGAFARNLLAAPRGSAKSVLLGTEVPLFLLLTRPYFRIVLSLATDKMIEARFDRIMKQITDNPMVVDDFGVQQPVRGKGIWNRHHIQLNNGSMMEGFSVTGRKRGARPDLFLLDDPEYDPESETTGQMMKEKFETFLFKQVIPMLEHGSGIFWIGTMISRRSFLYHAAYNQDPRFQFWNIKVLPALRTNREDPAKMSVLWEGKWSQEILEARRLEIGDTAFQSEYLNSPTSDEDRTLAVDNIKNEYQALDADGQPPLVSKVPIHYHVLDKETLEWKEKVTPAGELYSKMFRIITMDPARGMNQHSDYTCIAVLGFDSNNCLWVLDMWMGRAPESTLLSQMYKLGVKWAPRIVGIESVSMQIQIVDSAQTYLQGRAEGGWMPRVMPISYAKGKGPMGKSDRIATLEWRFDAGKIKYPKHLANQWPFTALYSQTRDFTYDLALLPFDDAIDAVAMGHYVVHGKGLKGSLEVQPPTTAEKIRAGKVVEYGIGIADAIDTVNMDPEILDALLDRSSKLRYNDGRDNGGQKPRYEIRRPNVLRNRGRK
jgi:hypothetical protein